MLCNSPPTNLVDKCYALSGGMHMLYIYKGFYCRKFLAALLANIGFDKGKFCNECEKLFRQLPSFLRSFNLISTFLQLLVKTKKTKNRFKLFCTRSKCSSFITVPSSRSICFQRYCPYCTINLNFWLSPLLEKKSWILLSSKDSKIQEINDGDFGIIRNQYLRSRFTTNLELEPN